MRKNKKKEIVTAKVHLMARQGAKGISVGQITTAAGVTEGALYRHFKGKEDLCQQAYFNIVADMTSTKEMIALSAASVAKKMREWVRVSYNYYDLFPDAFSYVFFTEHPYRQSWQEITTRQSRIFTRIIAQMQPTHTEDFGRLLTSGKSLEKEPLTDICQSAAFFCFIFILWQVRKSAV